MPSRLLVLNLLSAIFFFSGLVLFLTSGPAQPRFQIPLRSGSSKSPSFQSPYPNVWADLNDSEVHDVIEFLFRAPKALNLTRAQNASSWDNHIAVVEVLPPNKTDVLQYLKDQGSIPSRWARVIVNQGATEKAAIAQYMVGPLPANPDTQILPLTYLYNSGRNFVQNPLPDYLEMVAWFTDVALEMSDIIEDLLGEVVNPGHLPGAPPLMGVGRPSAFENGIMSTWLSINSPGLRLDAWSLLEQGLYCRFEISGRTSENWNVREWRYDGISYNSTAALRKAWKSPGFNKLRPNIDGNWTSAEPFPDGLDGREMYAPIMVQPFGHRYKIDENERFVSWMGFNFYISTMQATALSIWDIRFRGDSVIYQLGLQEALAHYAGNDPMTAEMFWLDTLFGMGFNMYELVPGYDCPSYATYLSASFHRGESTIVRKNSICIFEYTSDQPLSRHSASSYVTVSRDTYLVVRSISTVGNYDYTIDYIFYLDGAIEVKVRASGYIFGAYQAHSPREKLHPYGAAYPQYDYGYLLHDHVSSSMHDHVISFRADVDVAGTSNSIHRVAIEPYSQKYPWESAERKTMRLHHQPIFTEMGLNWPRNSGEMIVVLNNDTVNTWGEKRGYRIAAGTGMGNPPHLTMEGGSTALDKAAQWATRDLWFVRQKDTESKGASEYNAMETTDPLIDFGKMFDDESLEQEDLVVYFNLGSHHIPHSGDIPNTLMHTSASSVMFIPHNFADRDPSRDSAQGVKLDFRKGAGKRGSRVTTYGPEWQQDLIMKKSALQADLASYNAPDEGLLGLGWNATLASI